MINMPNLSHVGGDLNAMGNVDVNETSFPNLEIIKGDFVIANSGFKCLPPKLNHIGGRLIISKSCPTFLLEDILRLDKEGKILGGVFYCD